VPASADGVQVEFLSPQQDASINPSDDVQVAGTVSGLGNNKLWIMSWHEDGGSFFPVSGPEGISPVTDKNGPWSVTDEGVGNPSDHGKTIVYTAVLADAECTKTLSTKPDDYSFRAPLPQGCTILPDHRGVRVK
jgi:hypothetical protein